MSSIIKVLKSSLKGEHHDYTTGSIKRAVFLLAIPMVAEMVMESIFALVDIFFVNRLGRHATSTVGLTESVLTLIYSMAMGLSIATTAMVARRVGEKDPEAAAKAGAQSMNIALIMAGVLTLAGVIFAPDILRLMGGEPETIRQGTTYCRLMFGSSIFIILLFLINGIFRGAGNAMMAFTSLAIANICNIILCPILINGWGPIPAFGLTGAALATTIGRGVGVAFQLSRLFKSSNWLHLTAKSFSWASSVVKGLIKIAWPATLQFIIASCSWIFMARLVAETGHSAASAGYQTALRIIMFFILPAWGLSNAAATLVGQNLGAKEVDRAEKSVNTAALMNFIFMGAVTLIFLLLPNQIADFFTTETEVKNYVVKALRIISLGYMFYGVGMVMVSAFNGAGDTKTPTRINFIGFWLVQIPLAWILAETFRLGPTGVFIAIPAAETGIAIAAFLLFKRGSWKHISI